MLLKIILAIVCVKILIDLLWIKEGLLLMDDVMLHPIGDKSSEKINCNLNIVFPNFVVDKTYPVIDEVTKTPKDIGVYTNDPNLLYIGYNNILKASNPNYCK